MVVLTLSSIDITIKITDITSVLPLKSTVFKTSGNICHKILPLTSTGKPLEIPLVIPETFSMGVIFDTFRSSSSRELKIACKSTWIS